MAGWERTPLEYFAKVPSKLFVVSRLRNKLDGPLEAELLVRYDTKQFNGWADIQSRAVLKYNKGFDLHMKLGEEASSTRTIEINQQWERQSIIPELRFAGGLSSYTQAVPVVVTNALEAKLLPFGETEQPLEIRNPSGEAFAGVVKLIYPTEDFSHSATGPVAFAQGEIEKRV